MKVMFVSKQSKNKTISTDDIIKIFESSDDLNRIKKVIEKADDRIYCSWASVQMKDRAGELIPIDDIIKQQSTLLKRHGPISDEHTNRIIGETLAFKVMTHPESKSTGVLHLNKIHSDNDLDDQVWKEIVSGERKGSSVGGFNTGVSIGRDEVTGEKVKILEDFNQFETASVKEPCNPLALNESYSVVAKSNVSDIEKEKNLNKDTINNKISKKGDKMVNEDISEIKSALKSLMERVDKIAKQDEKPEEEEPKEEEKKKTKQDEEEIVEEKKKKQDEEKPEEEKCTPKKKKKKQEDEEEVTVEKEESAGAIEGEGTGAQPEEPIPEDSNDEDAFKMNPKMKQFINKAIDTAVAKTNTPFPMGTQDVKKAKEVSELPMKLALGQIKKSWREIEVIDQEKNDFGGI